MLGEVTPYSAVIFFFQAEDGIRDDLVTGVQTCALPILKGRRTWRGFTANCAMMELPKVSAVMPVPSEMKKTLQSVMGDKAASRPHEPRRDEIGRAHVSTPVTRSSRMPSSALKKKKNKTH